MENQNQDATPNPQQVNQQFSQFGVQQVPNSTAILVLGIISIVGCFCYGIVGIVTGIVALVLSSKAKALYEQNPGNYSEASVKNMRAGRVCAIIGTCLSGLYLVILIVYIAFFATVLTAMPWGDIMNSH
ncbi:MAG: CCC motif membrane protein [Bacteroidota bacterium]